MGRPPKYVASELPPFQQRVLQLIGEENQSEFARRAGISQSGLNRILHGGDAGREMLIAIANAGGRSVEWLATGEEPKNARSNVALVDAVPFDRVRYVDARPSAGPGRLPVDVDDSTYIDFPSEILQRLGLKPEHALATRLAGTSMEPTIADEALIIVGTNERSRIDNRIFFFSVGNDLFVKRLRLTPEGWAATSDNPAVPAWPLPEVDGVRIYGRVRWTEQLL